jgi:signal transduction histidine kinase
VRAIAEAHGGTVRVANRSTGGAVFTAVLPAVPTPTPTPTPTRSPASALA